jgi:tRNA pseudouridine55 synthase
LVLGRATRLARFLTSDTKRYEAIVQLGQATDTYDRLGARTGEPAQVQVTRDAVESALTDFRGEIAQVPPPYSAKKIGGVSAHRLARRGAMVTPVSARVTVHQLELLEVAGDRVTLDVVCSAGFYVRSLAHDLGIALGCGAHLAALRRISSGEWTLEHGVSLASCEQEPETARTRVVPMARLLTRWPAVRVAEEGVRRIHHGQVLRSQDVSVDSPGWREDDVGRHLVRILDATGNLLAIAERREHGFLHPGVVLV